MWMQSYWYCVNLIITAKILNILRSILLILIFMLTLDADGVHAIVLQMQSATMTVMQFYQRGALSEALDEFNKAKSICQRFDPDSLHVASTSLYIELMCWSQGKLDQALDYNQKQ
jgi:hypothetical protein